MRFLPEGGALLVSDAARRCGDVRTLLNACRTAGFAAAGGCCYPVTGETLVKPVYAFALCAAALLMAAGIIPFGAGKEEERIHE